MSFLRTYIRVFVWNLCLSHCRLNNIEKSVQDTRDYRGLKLQNGIKVLLISDTKTDVSAAALAVQVG